MDIGIKIKNLRNDRGMTLKELSEKSELSIGFLSQLERGLTTIAVDSLERISEIFKVPLAYFFDMPQKKDDKVLRSYELDIFDIEKGGFINYCLSANPEDKTFLPRLVELLPQNEDEKVASYRHNGEEFMYVLEGILTVYIDNERYDLYPGDSVHINSEVAHNWANYTNKKVKVLIVNSPNNFRTMD
jgi:transcriptional regulator with XRE-family HTH domain